LHIHTDISDGRLKSETLANQLRAHCDFRTITDHDDPSYHLASDNGCSFTGVEITSDIREFDAFADFLFYGFDKDDIPLLNKKEHLEFNMRPKQLSEYLQPIKDRTGAKLFLAHPYRSYASLPLYNLLIDPQGKLDKLNTSERPKKTLEDILDYCVNFVDGFECLHPSAKTEKDAVFLLEYCRKNKKLASGGSDLHGSTLTIPKYQHLVEEYYDLFQWIPEMAAK